MISNGTLYGSRAEIICPTGFEVDGPNIITCLKTGLWSNPIPSCIKEEEENDNAPLPPPTTTSTTVVPITPRPKITSRRPPLRPSTPRLSFSTTSTTSTTTTALPTSTARPISVIGIKDS